MSNVGVVSEVFQKFNGKESLILLKLKELDKWLTSRDFSSSYPKCEFTESKLAKSKMEILQHENAVSRNISFMKELNIAETQLRLMSCFCPTDSYLRKCRSNFMTLKKSS